MAGFANELDTDALDAIAARFAARSGQPGLAYGVVAGGRLVHSGGCGERWAGGPVPDASTVFRIASMTKSFTATMILALRDQGLLRLDDAAAEYVPELGGVRPPASDCPPISIRHLLTMTAGFTTDDPWGDRQQGLDPAEFGRLLAGGLIRTAWAPGTRFEYSNVGYAILGRVIAAVTGADYATAVRSGVLTPLGLTSTGYEASEFDPDQLTRGYRRDGDAWLELKPDGHGAFAPMGGIFSCVADLARWVAGFADAFPARAGSPADLAHPLSRATRREMQLGQVLIPAGGDGTAVSMSGPLSLSYGFGLFTEDDAAFGTIVQHGGGYPGYGSQMRWHPATGLGAVVLANCTYAAAGTLASRLLVSLLDAQQLRPVQSRAGQPRAGQPQPGLSPSGPSGSAGYRLAGPVPAPGEPWPQIVAARDAVSSLLDDWEAGTAAALFTPNVDLDRPLPERQADVALLRDRIGPFRADDERAMEFDSPAHCRWWLTGERGTVAVQIKLAPLQQPLVQQLIVPVPPAPGSALATVLAGLAGLLGSSADWPPSLETSGGLNRDEALRLIRVARAWCGPARLDYYLAGNGSTTATVRMAGQSGWAELGTEIADSGLALTRLAVSLGT